LTRDKIFAKRRWIVGRYRCAQGKEVGIAKANRVCLIKRCPDLLVQFKRGKHKRVVPITMIEIKGC
jgi:hypothetical protein